jgi:spermidine synthase
MQRAALAVMAASGFAGLGYQIVWTQQCALWLGHEAAAVLAVVAAFFGGLAAGSFALGARIERSRRPVRWYAACELIIALWSLVLALAMSPFSAWMLRITGVQPSPIWQWTVAFCGTFLLLLPATAAMGATLPAMERVTARMRSEGRSIALLYASNTLGATIGVLAIAFWLVPSLGLIRTAGVCIGLNLLCGLSSLVLFQSPRPSEFQEHSTSQRGESTAKDFRWSSPSFILMQLTTTGLLGIGYEILVVRVLSEVAEDTVYTFAMLLAVYLTGTAIGAAGYQRWLTRRMDSTTDADKLRDRLLCALAGACLIGTISLWAAESLKAEVLHLLGASMTAAIAAEATLAVVAFGLPTIVMGALFSHLSASASAAGVSFGRALGVNTLGAALAPLIFGVLALPLLGPKLALLSISLGYLALTSLHNWKVPAFWVPASVAIVLALVAPPLAFIDIPEGGQVVSYEDGVMAAVSVVEDAEGVARLRINNRQQEGSSSTLRVDGRHAWLPLLLHPQPRHALFLGVGTGVTATSAALDPSLTVDAVELLPEVISASSHFTSAFAEEGARDRLHLMAADARRYVRTSDRHYDVIVSDNFHPARSGSGSLYTVEHFTAVRERLEPQGVFCQWLPLHQLDLETVRSIVQSFVTVFPHGWAMLASNSLETPSIGLVARSDDGFVDIAALRRHMSDTAMTPLLGNLGIEDDFALLGNFIAGPQALRRFAGDAIANTDDRPVVAYRAPRITYTPDSLPRDRLFALLQQLSIEPNELIANAPDDSWPHRLAAYWSARDRFIESGRAVRPSPHVQEMLAQVREPLLAVLHISPDFRPAYDPLVLMATSLAQTNVADARALLLELAQTQPSRPEAKLALNELSAAP